MIEFTRFKLSNGMTVLHHYDASIVMVAFNLLYDVGSRDEHPDATGIAHLVEHLMFGGSAHVQSFDAVLQAVGGESNAWTNSDETNFYCVLPAADVETAFWLESDRMLALTLSDESIATQRRVVMEEYKQRVFGVPYGDVSHLLSPLAFTTHPYRWPAIGKDINDIATVPDDVVRRFHHDHYSPASAILCVSGNVSLDRTRELAEKWFGPIEPSPVATRRLPVEPVQREPRELEVSRDVPCNMLYRAYHIPALADARFTAFDLLSDVLGNGHSSRFFTNLVSRGRYFSELDASVSGSLDPGLLYINGKLLDGATWDEAEAAIDNVLQDLMSTGPTQYEVEKYANKAQSAMMFERIDNSTLATRLCQHEHQGDANLINTQLDRYQSMTAEDVRQAAMALTPDNCSTLRYAKA